MSKTIQNAAIFTGFLFLQRVVSFFLLPLYTHYLTPEDYGKVGLTTSLSAVLSIFFLLSLNAPIVRFFHDLHTDPDYIPKLWGNVLIILAANTAILIVILYVFRNLLLGLAMESSLIWPLGWIAVALASSSTLFGLYQAFLQTKQQASAFALNNLGNFLITVGSTVIFVVKYRMGALGVLYGSLFANAVFFLYSLVRLYPIAKISISKPLILSILAYSLPLVPHALSGWVTTTMDRIFLAKYLDISTVGLYNVAYQLSFVLITISSAVNQAYVPWFYSKARDGSMDALRKIAQATESGLVFYSMMGFCVSFWIEEILHILVNSTFWAASQYVPILVFSAVWSGIYFFLCAPIFYDKKATKWMPLITFGSALVNVFGNIYLIPIFGAYGAAVTSLAGNLTVTVVVAIYAHKVMHIPYSYSKVFAWIIILGVMPYSKLLLLSTKYVLFGKIAIFAIFLSIYALFNWKVLISFFSIGKRILPQSSFMRKIAPNTWGKR